MNTKSVAGVRRYDLDWLRVFAILSVFLFHSLHFFDPGDWSIKNLTAYPWVGWVMKWIGFWMMPMVFLIYGASLFYAILRVDRSYSSCCSMRFCCAATR